MLGVVYSGGAEARAFQVAERDVRTVLAGGQALFDLELDGSKAVPVVVKEQQMHQVRGNLEHIDLQEVKLDEEIQAEVAIELEGAEDGARRQGGRRARARHPRDHRRSAADRDPRAAGRRRLRDGDQRHRAAVRRSPRRRASSSSPTIPTRSRSRPSRRRVSKRSPSPPSRRRPNWSARRARPRPPRRAARRPRAAIRATPAGSSRCHVDLPPPRRQRRGRGRAGRPHPDRRPRQPGRRARRQPPQRRLRGRRPSCRAAGTCRGRRRSSAG